MTQTFNRLEMKSERSRQILREFFTNAVTLALLKQFIESEVTDKAAPRSVPKCGRRVPLAKPA